MKKKYEITEAKYEESNKEVSFVNKFNNLNLSSVKDLCLVLLQYQSVVEEAANKRLVHKMTHYINELAYQLHSFYNEEKIITDNINETLEKLTILLYNIICMMGGFYEKSFY